MQAERDAIRESVLDLVGPGIKGVELACEVAVRHARAADLLLPVVAEMVAAGDILELEYVTPDNLDSEVPRAKSFYLPAGTRIRSAGGPIPQP